MSLDETNNSDDFLAKLGIDLNNDALIEDAKNEISKNKIDSKKRNSLVKVYISQDHKLKFNLLDISPRTLCERFIDSFLENDVIKQQIRNKLKQLK